MRCIGNAFIQQQTSQTPPKHGTKLRSADSTNIQKMYMYISLAFYI